MEETKGKAINIRDRIPSYQLYKTKIMVETKAKTIVVRERFLGSVCV
jgi:hypothetical protein